MGDTVISDIPREGAFCLKGSGIRRCRGCVRCLTDHPGGCDIADGFSAIIPSILSSDRLVIIAGAVGGRVPPDIIKMVERMSNILEAYTDSGGNVPLPKDGVGLRTVAFRVSGEIDRDAFEREMSANLRKGPVRDVMFEYV